jgi:hypothetical protein
MRMTARAAHRASCHGSLGAEAAASGPARKRATSVVMLNRKCSSMPGRIEFVTSASHAITAPMIEAGTS